MKTQSSLEVPKQVRSASFDEIQLEAKRQQQQLQAASGQELGSLLRVPQFPGQRSRSVDSGATDESASNFLEVPRRFQRRRSSGSKSVYCVHCVCLEEYNRQHSGDELPPEPPDKGSLSISDTSSSEFEEEGMPECTVKVTNYTQLRCCHKACLLNCTVFSFLLFQFLLKLSFQIKGYVITNVSTTACPITTTYTVIAND